MSNQSSVQVTSVSSDCHTSSSPLPVWWNRSSGEPLVPTARSGQPSSSTSPHATAVVGIESYDCHTDSNQSPRFASTHSGWPSLPIARSGSPSPSASPHEIDSASPPLPSYH